MPDYINKEDLLSKLDEVYNYAHGLPSYYAGFQNAVYRMKEFPAAEVEPVRHGEWKIKWDAESDPKRYFVRIVCSSCGLITGAKSNYCPNCGAKMGGADNGK